MPFIFDILIYPHDVSPNFAIIGISPTPPTLGQSLWCTVPIIVEQIPSLLTPAVFDRKTLDYSLQSNLIGLMIQYGTKH